MRSARSSCSTSSAAATPTRPIARRCSSTRRRTRSTDISRAARRSATDGVSEEEPLSFESPYGCSKGAADQYVVDFHRSYGLPTVAMRQSCIYGPRQFGEEDQGWVAWFALAAVFGLPITFYGDGLQV